MAAHNGKAGGDVAQVTLCKTESSCASVERRANNIEAGRSHCLCDQDLQERARGGETAAAVATDWSTTGALVLVETHNNDKQRRDGSASVATAAGPP